MDVDAYLTRIGLEGRPPGPTPASLAELQVAHLLAVPFENLDIGLGRPISLALDAIYDKVVPGRRGGFCYELNGLFAWLLGALGYRVTLLGAQTFDERGAISPELEHLALRVDLDEPWLVDVGFGDAFREPIRLFEGEAQLDSLGRAYRLDRVADDWTLSEQPTRGAKWEAQYRFRLVAHDLADFEAMCRWQETEASYFTEHRLCTVARPTGRETLYDDRFITTVDGVRSERPVDEHEVGDLLRDRFGVRF